LVWGQGCNIAIWRREQRQKEEERKRGDERGRYPRRLGKAAALYFVDTGFEVEDFSFKGGQRLVQFRLRKFDGG
jgi:hypothetical protein